jgi:hypothetical protein
MGWSHARAGYCRPTRELRQETKRRSFPEQIGDTTGTAFSPRRHRGHGDRRTEDREQTTVGANHDSPTQTWDNEGRRTDGEPGTANRQRMPNRRGRGEPQGASVFSRRKRKEAKKCSPAALGWGHQERGETGNREPREQTAVERRMNPDKSIPPQAFNPNHKSKIINHRSNACSGREAGVGFTCIRKWLEAMSLREEKPAATPSAIGVAPCLAARRRQFPRRGSRL